MKKLICFNLTLILIFGIALGNFGSVSASGVIQKIRQVTEFEKPKISEFSEAALKEKETAESPKLIKESLDKTPQHFEEKRKLSPLEITEIILSNFYFYKGNREITYDMIKLAVKRIGEFSSDPLKLNLVGIILTGKVHPQDSVLSFEKSVRESVAEVANLSKAQCEEVLPKLIRSYIYNFVFKNLKGSSACAFLANVLSDEVLQYFRGACESSEELSFLGINFVKRSFIPTRSRHIIKIVFNIFSKAMIDSGVKLGDEYTIFGMHFVKSNF